MKKTTLSIVILIAALVIALLNMVLLHEEINELEQNLLIVQDENYGLRYEVQVREDVIRMLQEEYVEGEEE